jgi:uncharacterized protein YnzC (UPF0291/DUF896 family)
MKKPRCEICGKESVRTRMVQPTCKNYDCAIVYIKQIAEKKKLKQKKEWNKEKREKLPELYPKKYRKLLQDEVNKLSRMIDNKLGHHTCIDCGKTLIDIPQVDAAHFYNTKNHGNIRYNLHNVHSARSDCNFYSDNHKEGYKLGLAKRYSNAYLERVNCLDAVYRDIKLTNKEIAEKLKIVRKLIREFENYEITDGIQARDLFNEIIDIY